MEQFKAGDKAIFGNIVCDVFENAGHGLCVIQHKYGDSGNLIRHEVPIEQLRECFTVSILEDATAKDVGEPEPIVGEVTDHFMSYGKIKQHDAWRKSESRLRTLPWNMTEASRMGSEPVSMANGMPPLWYAYIDTIGGEECFVLVEPTKEESK